MVCSTVVWFNYKCKYKEKSLVLGRSQTVFSLDFVTLQITKKLYNTLKDQKEPKKHNVSLLGTIHIGNFKLL